MRLNDVIIPRKKGRPPPAVTEREIDDSYCIEFTLPWAKAKHKSDQIENCRFISNKMKSGKIIFREERSYEAVRDVTDPFFISLYHRTKYGKKFTKIDSATIPKEEISDNLNNIEVQLQQYSVRLSLCIAEPENQIESDPPSPEKPEIPVSKSHPQIPLVSAGIPQINNEIPPQTVQLLRDMDQIPTGNTGKSLTGTSFETSFPVSFILWVKFAEGLPDVREGAGLPVPPLPQVTIRSALLEEAITCRVAERTNNPQLG